MREVHCIEIVRTSGGHKDLEPRCSGSQRVPEVGSNCRLLIVPLFRGSSRFDFLILSHPSRKKVACECNE